MQRWGIGEWAAAFVFAALVSTSCSSADCAEDGTCARAPSQDADDGGSGSHDAGHAEGDAEAGVVGALLVTGKAPALVMENESAEIEVTVDRSGIGASAGPVRITLGALDGVSAAPLEIAPDTATAKLSIAVGARRHGKITLVLRAEGLANGARGSGEAVTTVRGSAGSLDTSFGTNGVFTHSVASSDATGIVVQADGKVVLAGRAGNDLLVARVLEDGKLDTSFSDQGTASLPVPGGGTLERTSDVVETAGGALALAFVRTPNGGNSAASVLRLTSTGVLDTSFGAGTGSVNVRARATIEHNIPGLASMIDAADGGLFVGGNPPLGEGQCVAKLKADGSPDTTWGNGGSYVYAPPNPCNAGAAERCLTQVVVREPSGEVLGCQPRGDQSVIHRISANGGMRTTEWYTTLRLGDCGSLALDPSTPGFGWVGGNLDGVQQLAVMRLKPGGEFVSPWGNDGDRFNAPEETGLTFARRLAVSGGNLVIGAEAKVAGEAHLAVARLTPTGVFDATFAGKGYVTLKAGGLPSTTKAMAIDALGRIIIAGTNGKMVAARFWP